MSSSGEAVRSGNATKKSSSCVRACSAWWTSRKPPPPGPVSGLSHTQETAAAAMQASTAFPPARRTSAPACGGERMTGCQRASHEPSVRFAAMGDVSFAADERAYVAAAAAVRARGRALHRARGDHRVAARLARAARRRPRGARVPAPALPRSTASRSGTTSGTRGATPSSATASSTTRSPHSSGSGCSSVLTVALAAGAFALPARTGVGLCGALGEPLLRARLAGSDPGRRASARARRRCSRCSACSRCRPGRRWTAAALIILALAASPVAFVLLAVVLAGIAVGRRPASSAARRRSAGGRGRGCGSGRAGHCAPVSRWARSGFRRWRRSRQSPSASSCSR